MTEARINGQWPVATSQNAAAEGRDSTPGTHPTPTPDSPPDWLPVKPTLHPSQKGNSQGDDPTKLPSSEGPGVGSEAESATVHQGSLLANLKTNPSPHPSPLGGERVSDLAAVGSAKVEGRVKGGSCAPAVSSCRGILTPHCTLIFRPPSILERLDLAELFPRSQPLEVELGSGDGSFLSQYAAARPEINFIGVERLLGRLRKLDRKGLRAGLTNLRLVRFEASYVLEYLLPRGSVQALHIYFPDPWPKRRHWKNRLVNARFPTLAGLALEPGGTVFLRTDDPDYFAQMTAVFGSSPEFNSIETPESLSSRLTDFERGFHAKGVPTLRAAYRRACA